MVAVPVERRRDGKLHPLGGRLPEPERKRARWLAHNLVHRDGLSIQQAQRVMAESYGLRRSLGSIMRDLQRWECPRCPHLAGQRPDC